MFTWIDSLEGYVSIAFKDILNDTYLSYDNLIDMLKQEEQEDGSIINTKDFTVKVLIDGYFIQASVYSMFNFRDIYSEDFSPELYNNNVGIIRAKIDNLQQNQIAMINHECISVKYPDDVNYTYNFIQNQKDFANYVPYVTYVSGLSNLEFSENPDPNASINLTSENSIFVNGVLKVEETKFEPTEYKSIIEQRLKNVQNNFI